MSSLCSYRNLISHLKCCLEVPLFQETSHILNKLLVAPLRPIYLNRDLNYELKQKYVNSCSKFGVIYRIDHAVHVSKELRKVIMKISYFDGVNLKKNKWSFSQSLQKPKNISNGLYKKERKSFQHLESMFCCWIICNKYHIY